MYNSCLFSQIFKDDEPKCRGFHVVCMHDMHSPIPSFRVGESVYAVSMSAFKYSSFSMTRKWNRRGGKGAWHPGKCSINAYRPSRWIVPVVNAQAWGITMAVIQRAIRVGRMETRKGLQ